MKAQLGAVYLVSPRNDRTRASRSHLLASESSGLRELIASELGGDGVTASNLIDL